MSDRVIFRKELCAALGVGSECVRLWLKAGKLPPPDVALSLKTVGWLLSSLRAHGINLV